jgi:hypothetical protein
MSQNAIQADLDAISNVQVPNQLGNQRTAIFFEPGTYGSAANPLVFQVGYYTEVTGLGAMPQDTVIDGAVVVFNQCSGGICNGTDNFWRSLSNLTINVDIPSSPPIADFSPSSGDPYGLNCQNSGEIWAASQDMPIRRTIVNGNVILMDYCSPTGYVSGGFMADDEINGAVDFYGQQQYLIRNSNIGSASNSVWNMVFSGVNGAPAPVFSGNGNQNTVVGTSPVTEEEPFLYTDSSGNYNVFVPAVQHNSVGPSWASGSEAGTSISFQNFFVANPTTSVSDMNTAMAQGRDLLLTPGIYDLSAPIEVPNPDTVVMGLGFATLVPQNGNAAVVIDSNAGVKLSGLIIDAGPVNSPELLSVGTSAPNPASATDPDLIQDVCFRIGGAETTLTSASVSLLDNADNSIIDDLWAWRADHGVSVDWNVNTADTGVIVNGDNVTAYGLAVEHYQKYEVVWNGNGGTDIFFQNEMPYDPPSQAAWMEAPGVDGWAAFKVSDQVTSFTGYGMGSYSFFNLGIPIEAANAFEVPQTLPAGSLHDLFTVFLSTAGSGGIMNVVDNTGGSSTIANPDVPVDVVSYP